MARKGIAGPLLIGGAAIGGGWLLLNMLKKRDITKLALAKASRQSGLPYGSPQDLPSAQEIVRDATTRAVEKVSTAPKWATTVATLGGPEAVVKAGKDLLGMFIPSLREAVAVKEPEAAKPAITLGPTA